MNEMERETAELAGILNKVYKCNCVYFFSSEFTDSAVWLFFPFI